MAIQNVGGSKVYVITGTTKDPRYTSTGQSWANLVTSQKYALWEAAYKEAQSQIADERLKYEIELKAREELKSDIAAKEKQVAGLRSKQITAGNSLRDDYVRAQARYEQGYRAGGGKGGKTDPNKDEASFLRERRILKQGYDAQSNRLNAQLKPKEKQYADMVLLGTQFDPEGIALKEEMDAIKREKAAVDKRSSEEEKIIVAFTPGRQLDPDEAQLKADIKAARGVQEGGSYGSGTTVVDRKAPDPALYEQQATEAEASYQAEIDRINEEIAALEGKVAQPAPLPPANALERARGIYSTQFGGRQQIQPPQQPINIPGQVSQVQPPATSSMSANRLAELEALGVDEQFMSQFAPYSGDQPEYISQPQFYSPSAERGNVDQQMAALDQFALQEEAARTKAEAAYQPSPLARIYNKMDPDANFTEADFAEFDPSFADVRQDRKDYADWREGYIADQQGIARAQAEYQRALSPELGAPSTIPESEDVVSDAEAIRRRQIMMDMNLDRIPPAPATMRMNADQRELELQALGINPQTQLPQLDDFLYTDEEKSLPEIPYSLRYKNNVILAAHRNKDKDKIDEYYKNKKKAPDYAQLVMDLYPIDKSYDQAKKDEMLQNAWDQITITYSGDELKRQQAHELLIAIDMLEEQKLDIKEEK